ncbi:ATP-binding protein [Pseudomonas sp. MWU16-30317]|uniref:sensor histidine kinase n=1 Tax=Pseudomonas sp. MWU16-30317 TaxID=2878095 RepID=UPI001CF99EA8|nr:ATP-binding protein [Pseudomonas sp. MWU16-30317]
MSRGTPTLKFRSWIWQAFVRTSLVPLIVVELVLLAAYFLTNQAILEAQSTDLHRSAARELQSSVMQNSDIVQAELAQLRTMGTLLSLSIENELQEVLPYHPAQLAVSADGVRYSGTDQGGPASFYSNITPLARQDMDMVDRLSHVDFMMKGLKDSNPLITSVYFNSGDSYNRIYPWIDSLAQYPHDMNIPSFNFYYLADAQHNPQRQPVWTDVYLDPAGKGWMMSVVVPVYQGDLLRGVAGIDITIDAILQKIASLHVPWGGYLILVSKAHTIMALPEKGETDFDVPKLATSAGYKGLSQEHFKPIDFQLANHPKLRPLEQAMQDHSGGVESTELGSGAHLVAWSPVKLAGWRLLGVVDEKVVMRETQRLANHFRYIGYLMASGLVAFYAFFFGYLWLQARRLSLELHAPIFALSNMMREIGQGNWAPPSAPSRIEELNAISLHALGMGKQLAHAEASRSAVQQRLEMVMGNVTEGLLEYYPNTHTFSFKGALCERFGLPADKMAPDELYARMGAGDRIALERLIITVRSNEDHVAEAEFRLPDRQGDMIWLLCRASMLSNPTERRPSVVGTCIDIDALKHVEQDLRAKTVEAQAASRAKSRFISSMSHELKTPLNAILGFAQLGQIKTRPDSTHLDEIIIAGHLLCQLVDDLLEWSSLQAEAPRLDLKPVDVEILLTECAAMIEPQLLVQGLALVLQKPSKACTVRADSRRTKQVLLNLLSNAVKYNRAGGSITLGIELDSEQSVARLFVEDTGEGIDADVQQQLFQPFQRLGKENSTIQGTGIGLALCKELADLMGGKMGVRSQKAAGSRFWLELPIYRRA